MGTLFVLVSPCFRENVVVTCKIGSFLCSLDNSEKRNCFLFWKSNFKMALIWNKDYFWPLLTFFSHQGKVTNIPSAYISLTYIHVFCSRYWLFLPYQFWKKYELSGTVSLWYDLGEKSMVQPWLTMVKPWLNHAFNHGWWPWLTMVNHRFVNWHHSLTKVDNHG